MKILLLLIVQLLISTTVFSQFHEWVRTYNGSGNANDQGFFIKADPQGNIIVSGRTNSAGNNTDFCTIKYNSTGAQLWAATFDGPAHNFDESAGLAVDNAGNVYVTGLTRNAALFYDIQVIKYNPAGTVLWMQTWSNNSNLNDIPSGIFLDNAGNVYITGNTEVTSNTNYNYITLKYNSSGVLQWAKQYNHPMNNNDKALFIDGNANNIFVTGTSNAPGTYLDYLTIKYDLNGDTLWTARYFGVNAVNEIPYGFKADAFGNTYITGTTDSTGSGTDYMTIKYNTNGTEQWRRRYTSPGSAIDRPVGLAVDNSGNVFVTGNTRINSSYNDIGTLKYSPSGVQDWFMVYNNAGVDKEDKPGAITVDNAGNVYVTGMSAAEGFNVDVITLKYNNAGVQQWATRYDSTEDEETSAITIDAGNNIAVTGYRGYHQTDLLTIKYSSTNGISLSSNEIPNGYELSQNYPNPFNPVTNINFSIPKTGMIKLTVFDVTGRIVAILVNEVLIAGTYRVDFNSTKLSSGVYFYNLTSDSYSQTKKMMLLK